MTPEALYGRPLPPFAAAISWQAPRPFDPYDPPSREGHQSPAKTLPPPQPPHHIGPDFIHVFGHGLPVHHGVDRGA